MADQVSCPYCRMPFDDQGPPRIFCTACGMPHHEDCYQENGGCTVFGCARAPADDPKLQVSYSDLQMPQPAAPVQMAASISAQAYQPLRYGSGPLGLSAAAAPVTAAQAAPSMGPYGTPALALPGLQPAPYSAVPRAPKSRTTYILLGVFLGAFGAHNFYAGYTGRAVGQLCLSVLTLFYLALIAWIWAIVEICIVDKDSAGIQFS